MAQKFVQTLFIGCLIMLPMMAAHCPPRRGYFNNYQNVTSAKFRLDELNHTVGGVMYKIPANVDAEKFKAALDAKTDALELCLEKINSEWTVQRQWFAVFVPANWYTSKCSGQQMIPSQANYKLCEQKKICDKSTPPVCVPIKIPVECRNVVVPTTQCPCPCNFRSVIQEAWGGAPLPAVVTAPDLRLYKAELARMVTGVNNVWANKDITKCLQ